MNDPLFGNKLAAAVITALLLFFGLPQLASALIGGGHHGKPGEELHLAYPIEFQTESAGKADAKPEVDFKTLLAGAVADVGKRRAAVCGSCHSFEKGGANGTGPNLWDIVGREVASTGGFGYSSALTSFGGEWTFERLDKYLANSQDYIAGTAMNQRIRKATMRAEILAYLASLSDNPVPLPSPGAPPSAAAEEAVEDVVEDVAPGEQEAG
ncbi:MAG: c-type cytochrome [Pseudomonadota bacterium]